MKISEIFLSIQGEGRNIGRPAIFVRTFGCDQSCDWCDTRYSWEQQFKEDALNLPPSRIADIVRDLWPEKPLIVFTGGEPVLWDNEIITTVTKLHGLGAEFAIETSGTLWNLALWNMFHTITVSPKLGSSGMKPVSVEQLRKFEAYGSKVELKFAIGSMADLNQAFDYAEQLDIETSFMSVTVGVGVEVISLDRIIDEVKDRKKNIKVLPRLHVDIWGNKRGV